MSANKLKICWTIIPQHTFFSNKKVMKVIKPNSP